MSRGPGCPFGSHRAGGALPQAAARLDASPEIWDNELRIRVERLNLDSSSMRQIADWLAVGKFSIAVPANVGMGMADHAPSRHLELGVGNG